MTLKQTAVRSHAQPTSSLWRCVATSVVALIGGLTHLTTLAAGASAAAPPPGNAPTQEWTTLGGDMTSDRYSKASQINAENFATLKQAWAWDGASFHAVSGRSTPSYIDGKLFTVAGERRYVVALDPATGETIWSYVEP
jgi:quinoprotein glucose dehydrogenase